MAETFSLEDNEVRRAPLLDLSVAKEEAHSDEFLSSQSAKLHLALKDKSPGLDEVSSAMTSGNSEVYRRLLADQDEINQIETRNDILSSVLQADPSAVTPEVVDVVHGLSNMEVRSPDLSDIIEKKYASIYTNTAVASLDNDIVEEAMNTDPESSFEMMDRTETIAFKQSYANTKLDEARKAIEDQSYLGAGYNIAENAILGRYQTYGQVDADFVSSVLPGSNRLEQYAYLWGLSGQDFKEEFDKIDDDLKSRNPYTRQQWLEGFFSYGNADAQMETIAAGVDVAQFIPVGKLATALKGVARGATKNPLRLHEVAKDLGKFDDAGVGKIVQDLKENTFDGSNIRNARELGNSVPSISDPMKLLEGSQNVPQAAYLRYKQALLERAELAKKFLTEPNLVDRATPDELVAYKDILRRDVLRENPSIQKNVIDVEVSQTADIGNVYQAKIILGQRDGSLFESEKQAQSYFKRFIKGTDDFQIVQEGQGFKIEINRNVDESRLISDVRLGTSQRTPESLSDTFAATSWLRTPVEILSSQQTTARAVSTSTKELLDSVYSRMAEPFHKLSNKEMNELQDLMVDNRQKQEYFKNFGEFEDAFFARFKNLPTETQTDAYFSYVQLNDLDLVVRDLDVYKQKARLGIEDMRIKIDDKDLSFEGKVINDLPYSLDNPFRVGIIENGKLKGTKFSAVMGEADRLNIKKLQEQGYKIVNTTDPNFKIGEKYFDYLVVRDLTRNRIGVKNIERRAGGHKIQKYPYYIKQAQISGDETASFYRGDKTFFNFRSQKEADEFLTVLEEARQKLLRQDPDAMVFLRDNIPISTKEFMAAVADGDINLKVPFTTTRAGMRTLDTGAYSGIKNLKDGTNNPHKPQILGRYLGERSEADIKTIKSEADGRFRVEAAPYLSPMDAMRTATSDMISTRVMNDYSLMTRDTFIREFSDLLEGTREEQLSQGMAVLQNPTFKKGIEQTQLERVQRAKNVARSYNNLMSYGTALDRRVEITKEKLLSKILPKIGPRGQQWVEDRMLSSTKDPGVYLRSFAFNMKMGFWNPIQYFKQANSLVNVAAIGGTNGLKSGILYPFMRAAIHTGSDDVLKTLGMKAEKIGLMKADDFVESMKLYKKSGFNEIGHDVAYLDDLRSPELAPSKLSRGVTKVLSTSRAPFAEGERLTRLAGWNTAYLEQKALLKGKKFDRRAEAATLFRAKTLVGNMTREANAPWQKGYAATMTQFFGYQARIMEQFIGKQLTGAEKARLFAGYSMMYGVPVATGAVAGVIPIRDMVLDFMNENGMDTNDPAATFFLDGFVTGMSNLIFDEKFNIASSYGPGGLPTFYDMFRGDKDFAEVLLGASGGIGLQTLSDSWPALRAMASEFSDFEGGYYNLSAEDFLQPLRNISSVNSAAQLYNVYNFGVWASKNGVNIMEMDLPEAVLATLTGLQPAEIEDSFSKFRAVKSFKEKFKADQKDMIKEFRRIMKVESSQTRDLMIRKIKARMVLEGFTVPQMKQTWKYAADKEMMSDVFFEQYEKEVLSVLNRQDRARSLEEN